MKHKRNCPSFDFEYEYGSGMEIPNCTCGAETDYGTVTHPMEGLRVDNYAALKAERDALDARVKELENDPMRLPEPPDGWRYKAVEWVLDFNCGRHYPSVELQKSDRDIPITVRALWGCPRAAALAAIEKINGGK